MPLDMLTGSDDEQGKCKGKGKGKGMGKKEKAIATGKFKTAMCKFHEKGKCRLHDACTFAHSASELSMPTIQAQAPAIWTGKKKGKGKGLAESKPYSPPCAASSRAESSRAESSRKCGQVPGVRSHGHTHRSPSRSRRGRSRSVSLPRQWLLTATKRDILVKPLEGAPPSKRGRRSPSPAVSGSSCSLGTLEASGASAVSEGPTLIGKVLAGPSLFLAAVSEVSRAWLRDAEVGCICICKKDARLHPALNVCEQADLSMFDPEMVHVRKLEEDIAYRADMVKAVITAFEMVDTSVNSQNALEMGKCNVLFVCKRGRHRSAAALAAYMAWNTPGARPAVIKDLICKRRPAAQFLEGPLRLGNGKVVPGLGPLVDHLVAAFRTVRQYGKHHFL